MTEGDAMKCPRCGCQEFRRAGLRWAAGKRVQLWQCQGCGRTQREPAQPAGQAARGPGDRPERGHHVVLGDARFRGCTVCHPR